MKVSFYIRLYFNLKLSKYRENKICNQYQYCKYDSNNSSDHRELLIGRSGTGFTEKCFCRAGDTAGETLILAGLQNNECCESN